MTGENRFVQFSKTKMCKFEVLGKCKKGRECPFAHATKELKQLPDLRCTKLCKSFVLTGICADQDCKYAHSKDELRTTGVLRKTKMCRFMQTGHCALGAKCNFAHSKVELRSTDKDTTKHGDIDLPHQGIAFPPGLGWESTSSYSAVADTGFMQSEELLSSPTQFCEIQGPLHNEIPDLSSLAHALDGSSLAHAFDAMLAMQQSGHGAEPAARTASDPPKPVDLARDSPAYVRLSSPADGFFSSITCQPVKTSTPLGQLNFDYLKGDEQSLSTQSPPPSPTGSSGRSSEKTWSPTVLPGSGLRHYINNEATGVGKYDPVGNFAHTTAGPYPQFASGFFGGNMFMDHEIMGA